MDIHAETWVTPPPTLITARLVLRPMGQADPDELATAINHYNVSKWLTTVPYPYEASDAAWFIAENVAGRLRTWAIYQDGALIGGMGADRELGYWLTPTAWGHGFATEAGRAVVAEMFADPIVEVVQSSHFVENTASRNVLYKLGFEDACGHVHHSKARGEDVPGRTVQLTRTRWEARQDG